MPGEGGYIEIIQHIGDGYKEPQGSGEIPS
jgi:hypothetical protein